jgi:hypothetical protein
MTDEEDRYFWWYIALTMAMGAVPVGLFIYFTRH